MLAVRESHDLGNTAPGVELIDSALGRFNGPDERVRSIAPSQGDGPKSIGAIDKPVDNFKLADFVDHNDAIPNTHNAFSPPFPIVGKVGGKPLTVNKNMRLIKGLGSTARSPGARA